MCVVIEGVFSGLASPSPQPEVSRHKINLSTCSVPALIGGPRYRLLQSPALQMEEALGAKGVTGKH